MKFGALIQSIYFDSTPSNRKDYEKGRKLFLYEGCFAVGIFSLTSGAFLAGIANYMGATDEFNGIIGAIPVFAGVVQLFSGVVFEKLEKRKFLISILCFFFRLLLGLIFFIPFIFKASNTRLTLLAGTYGLAYLFASFISPPANNWIVSLIPEQMRGSYLAKKDAYSLTFLTIVTLIVGKVSDIFRQANKEHLGFIFLGIIVMSMAVSNFYFLSLIKEPKVEVMKNNFKLSDIFLKPIKDKRFRVIIILFVLWNIGLQIAGPFFAVYMVTGLKLSYSYIMIMGVLSSVARIFMVPYWGKLADNKSWVTCTKYSIGLLAIIHTTWFFVNHTTAWIMVPILHILSGIAWGGINMALFNIQFIFSPKEGRTLYLGANAAYGGVLGFLSTIIGSTVLGLLQEHNFALSAFRITNMQILFAMSGILIAVCALYVQVFLKDTAINKAR